MGRFDDVKQTAKLAKTVWDANEQWARIVAIEGRTGPFARIRLEIHLEGRDPYQHVASTVIPRDVEPQVGQDVAIVNRTGPGASSASWGIKWHKQPQYGYELDAKPMSQDIVAGVMQAQEQVAQAWVAGNPAATSPPAARSDRARRSADAAARAGRDHACRVRRGDDAGSSRAGHGRAGRAAAADRPDRRALRRAVPADAAR